MTFEINSEPGGSIFVHVLKNLTAVFGRQPNGIDYGTDGAGCFNQCRPPRDIAGEAESPYRDLEAARAGQDCRPPSEPGR